MFLFIGNVISSNANDFIIVDSKKESCAEYSRNATYAEIKYYGGGSYTKIYGEWMEFCTANGGADVGMNLRFVIVPAYYTSLSAWRIVGMNLRFVIVPAFQNLDINLNNMI